MNPVTARERRKEGKCQMEVQIREWRFRNAGSGMKDREWGFGNEGTRNGKHTECGIGMQPGELPLRRWNLYI